MNEDAVFARVFESFSRQGLMATLGAVLDHASPGRIVIGLPSSPAITQQHGFGHAGAIASILDSACGYAALTLMPEGKAVLTSEFKINLLAPAAGSVSRRRGASSAPASASMWRWARLSPSGMACANPSP